MVIDYMTRANLHKFCSG